MVVLLVGALFSAWAARARVDASGTATEARRVVVSLGTIPPRAAYLPRVIESLRRQTRRPDAIYVCMARHYAYLPGAGPASVPGFLRDDPLVRVVMSEARDNGPANKLLLMLDAERDPGTLILVVDDDWEYPPTTLELLLQKAAALPGHAVGGSGARLKSNWKRFRVSVGADAAVPAAADELQFVAQPPRDTAVDILQGAFGMLYSRGMFVAADLLALAPTSLAEPLFFADDVLFAAYLAHRGVRKTCVSGLPMPSLLPSSKIASLSGGTGSHGTMTRNYRLAVPAMQRRLGVWQNFSFAETEQVDGMP